MVVAYCFPPAISLRARAGMSGGRWGGRSRREFSTIAVKALIRSLAVLSVTARHANVSSLKNTFISFCEGLWVSFLPEDPLWEGRWRRSQAHPQGLVVLRGWG